MTRPVFGVDRDLLARTSWGRPPVPPDDDGEPCEFHGDNRAACEAFEIQAQADLDQELIAAGQPPVLNVIDHREFR